MNAPLPAAQLTPVAQAASGASELDRLLQADYSPRYMLEGDSMDKMLNMAEQMAKSKLSVPEHLRGNVGDCLAIITQAMLWNMNPFAVAQKTHVVSGRLGYEAQLVIAVVQNSGAIRGAFRFETRGTGAAIEVRAGAVLRGETEVTWGEWLSASSVTTKNSPLWKTNVAQQMSYLQAKNWSRLYCPGAILGVYSIDELEDAAPMGGSVQPKPAAAPAPAAPTWPAEAFAQQLPRWTKAVEAGMKTAADIETLATSKGALTAEQLAAIRALKPAAPAPAAATEGTPAADGWAAEYDAAEGVQQ
jgi:hypothetical protein